MGDEDHNPRAQHAWGMVDEVRPLTPTVGGGPRADREGTPVPFGWEGNENSALTLVDADLSFPLSPIEMESSLQVVDPSFEYSKLEPFDSKLEQSEHSQSAETAAAFAPISITR